jgi:hypothetical protein
LPRQNALAYFVAASTTKRKRFDLDDEGQVLDDLEVQALPQDDVTLLTTKLLNPFFL